MNPYQHELERIGDNAHLISMVPVEQLLRLGYEIGLQEHTRVLDLCCGYGTLLKVWNQAFGITGVGVDWNQQFLTIGKERLQQAGITSVELVCADVKEYETEELFDVVICSETFDSIEDTLALGKCFLKEGGILCYQKVYAKVDNPPQDLLDFEGEVLPLAELNRRFHLCGLRLCAMASDTDAMWEHYVLHWAGNANWAGLELNPEDEELQQWARIWEEMYFAYRRPFEGQALFALKAL